MLQRVYRQIKEADAEAKVTIATSKSQISAIHNQLGEQAAISAEPCRRDTFPAMALAAAAPTTPRPMPGREMEQPKSETWREG